MSPDLFALVKKTKQTKHGLFWSKREAKLTCGTKIIYVIITQ